MVSWAYSSLTSLNAIFLFFFKEQGLLIGDFIVNIGEVDVKWSKHDEVVSLIKSSGTQLEMCVITPIGTDFLQGKTKSYSDEETENRDHQDSGSSTLDKRQRKREKDKAGSYWSLPRTLRRRSKSRDKKSHKHLASTWKLVLYHLCKL